MVLFVAYFSLCRVMLRIAIRSFVRRRASPLASFRSLIVFLVAVLSAGWLLAACTPTYDWRTIMNNDNGYTVDLPAKPTTDERKIDIGGTPMDMSMQIAEADGAVFAVGTVMLPSDDPQVQRTALDFLRSGLAHNLGTAPNAHATEIPLAAGGEVPGLEMTFSGKAGPKQETRTMHARLVAKGRHVYQAAVIASKEPPPEQIEQFFGSFKLY
jgi:hypothetical protein